MPKKKKKYSVETGWVSKEDNPKAYEWGSDKMIEEWKKTPAGKAARKLYGY